MVIPKAARSAALERQIERVTQRLYTLNTQSAGFWPLKLGLIFIGTAVTIGIFGVIHWLGILCALLVIALFFVIDRRHRKTDQSLVRHRVWLQLKNTQLARMHLEWSNIPAVQPRNEHANHPFDTDLDITGERSSYAL